MNGNRAGNLYFWRWQKMPIVNVFIMRHGEKEDGKKIGISNDLTSLTPLGVEQVINSAKTNLFGIIPDALYCSLKYRAAQTVLTACSVLPNRNNGCSVIALDGFDYSSAPNLNLYSQYTAEAEKRVKSGEKETVAMWMDIAPEMVRHLREKIQQTIIKVAYVVPRSSRKEEYNIIVGCHSPSSELAALDPVTMFMLREADIVKYTVMVGPCRIYEDYSVAKIIASEYIPRGF